MRSKIQVLARYQDPITGEWCNLVLYGGDSLAMGLWTYLTSLPKAKSKKWITVTLDSLTSK